jgi:hypothetical protein
VRATLRAAPNRIVVGEVRGAEALDLLDAWATGHPGGVATMHAEDAAGALARLDRLAQRATPGAGQGGGHGLSHAPLIAEAVHLVVVLAGGTGTGIAGTGERRMREPAAASTEHEGVVAPEAGTMPPFTGRRVVSLARVTGLAPDGRYLLHHYPPESDS